MSDCQRKARHPEEGGEWRSPLKRGHPEEGDRPAVVDAGVRLRYTEGGLRAEERRGRGVQSGCTATGALAVSAQNRHLSRESERFRRLLRKALRRMEPMGRRAHGRSGLVVWASKPPPTFSGLAEAWTR